MKNKNLSGLGVLGFAVLGAAVVGGFVLSRGGSMPAFTLPTPDAGTGTPPAPGGIVVTPAPAYGVGGAYGPSLYEKYAAQYGGGIVVTPGGGTTTPTLSSDSSSTAGVSFGVGVGRYYGGN